MPVPEAPRARPAAGPDTVRRVEQASGRLATDALARMDRDLPWFAALPAEQRSWVGLVAQAGIAAFVGWLRRPRPGAQVAAEVFGAAPRALARAISLQQTVELVRVTVEVVETAVPALAAPGDERPLQEAVLRFSREIAFAAAVVYAQAAEARGAWDARLEALVVDSLLRGEADDDLRSRAAALGWSAAGPVRVMVGGRPDGEPDAVLEAVRRAARRRDLDALTAVHGDLLVVVLGLRGRPGAALDELAADFGPGPVTVGPAVADLVVAAASAEEALAARRAAAGWPMAPRPVAARELLPERALAGEARARRLLVEDVYSPLERASGQVLATVATFLESAGSLEATARALFVHPNTVRYRLRRAADLTGLLASHPREGFVLHVALVVGRLEPAAAVPAVAVGAADRRQPQESGPRL